MNIRHVWLIIKREYMERLRSAGFAIGTTLGILGLAGLSFLPALFNLLDQENALKVAVVDPHHASHPSSTVRPTLPAAAAQSP